MFAYSTIGFHCPETPNVSALSLSVEVPHYLYFLPSWGHYIQLQNKHKMLATSRLDIKIDGASDFAGKPTERTLMFGQQGPPKMVAKKKIKETNCQHREVEKKIHWSNFDKIQIILKLWHGSNSVAHCGMWDWISSYPSFPSTTHTANVLTLFNSSQQN